MLAKETVLDRIEVLESGVLQVRFATYVNEDGKRITGAFHHRATFEPDAPLPADVVVDEQGTRVSLPARVTAISQAVWTPDVVQKYRDAKAAAAALVPAAANRSDV